MISIVTINFHSEGWRKIQEEMIKKYTTIPYKLIVIDNTEKNRGHGAGLDIGIKQAKTKYVILLDIDAFPHKRGWAKELIDLYEKSDVKIIAGEGGKLKPIRPCILFGETDYLKTISFEPVFIKDRVSLDVGIFVYFKTLHSGYKVLTLPVGKKYYPNTWCDTYYLNNQPIVSHHWYGTRFEASKHLKIDNRNREDYFKSKKLLFKLINEDSGINNSI